MSSRMDVEGVYYSKLTAHNKFMWAFTDSSEVYPAHFGSFTLYEVIGFFHNSKDRSWSFSESSEKHLLLSKGMVKWKDQ